MKAEFALCLTAGFFLGFISSAAAKPAAPQTYTFSAQSVVSPTLTLKYMIYRDDARERVEVSLEDGTKLSTTILDFQSHKFYGLRSVEAGGCEVGRYLSPRAPVDRDSVTAGADILPTTQHKVIRSETVHGIPARLEEFAPEQPSDKPIRVWLADRGDFVVKMEGKAEDGKPMLMYEITKWSAKKPLAALLTPPENCKTTDHDMSDAASIRAHGESKQMKVEVKSTIDFGPK
jgi:hypothetical protein